MIPTIEHIKPLISRRTKGIITTLAIALNLLIIAFFLFMRLDFNDTSLIRRLRKIRTTLKKKHPREEWATLSPKLSQLGAPVILVQAPSTFVKTTADKQKKERIKNKQEEQNTTIADGKISQDIQKETDLSAALRQAQDERLAQEEPTQLVQEIQATAKSETKKQKKTSTSLEQAIKAALAKKLKESTSTDAILQQVQDERMVDRQKQSKPAIIKTQNDIQKTLPKQTQPSLVKTIKDKQITFAQLVKGFTEHLKTEGEYTISMQGKSGAKATEHQLRVGRFIQKIIQCMQTSWKVNKNRYPLNHRVLASIVVRVVINKDGSLGNLIIQKTSGRQIIDRFVLDILKDAGKSFPPIPHYLNQEVCVITCNWEKIPLPEGPSGYTITR